MQQKNHVNSQPSMQATHKDQHAHSSTATTGLLNKEEDQDFIKGQERSFDLVVDKVPYLVKISPFSFNGEQRYYISINGSSRHVFTWDEQVSALRAIDDDAAEIPSSVEEEISRRLIGGTI